MKSCFWSLLLAVFAVGTLPGCGGNPAPNAEPETPAAVSDKGSAPTHAPVTPVATRQAPAEPPPTIYSAVVSAVESPVVIVHTTAGDITIELDIERAPQTVLNFLDNYVRAGFYEETIFHHIDSQSFVAAGGFTTELALKPTVSPIYNESNNGLSNLRGTVAMSRDASSAHSATSQFFINVADNPGLDFQGIETDEQRGYCVFGRVIDGMEVVDQISQSEVLEQGEFDRLPAEPVAIESIEEVH